MSGPLVSVVTPFHNTQEFLAECIESVLRQTYENWEYVLVDNQSNDGSSEIAAKYAAQFPGKIRLIHTDTLLPQVQNYNFALSCISASSKYCKMVQADDWIYPECLAQLVEVAEGDGTAGIVSSYRLKGRQVMGDGIPEGSAVFPGAAICRQHLTSTLFAFGTPTTLLYRSEIVRHQISFFDENALHEDTDACYRILRTWNFGFVHQVLSFTRVDNDSIMTRARDFHPKYLDRLLQLHKFGPVYLAQDEFAREMRAWESEYYDFLARRALALAGREFWRYQAEGLQSGGQRIKPFKLLGHILLRVLSIVTNPGMTCSKLYRKLRGTPAEKGTHSGSL